MAFRSITVPFLVVVLTLGCGAARSAADQPGDKAKVLRGKAAMGSWRDDAPGVRRLLTLKDLPGTSADRPNEVELVKMPDGAAPRVPEGFTVELFASGLKQPRVVRVAPNGDVFVVDSKPGEVHVFRPGAAGSRPQGSVFATGLKKPYGLAFYPPGADPEWVYVANTDSVVRFHYSAGDLKSSSAPETVVAGLPWQHHWTRDICFSPDGLKMYLAVGSGSNVALDMFPEPREDGKLEAWKKNKPLGAAWDTEERRANVLTYTPDGKDEAIMATGLRNPSGIAIQPATGKLWAVINERDGLGGDTPFEYATSVREGAFYGWPWYYMGGHEDPRQKGKRPDLKGKLTEPDVLLQAHTAPLQIAFYESDAFPAEYKGDAFVTMHGSWDRAERVGYKVVRMHFDEGGQASGEVEDFMTGFVVSDKQVWGRPVGVAVGPDGSLYVTEDGSGTVWRVTHRR